MHKNAGDLVKGDVLFDSGHTVTSVETFAMSIVIVTTSAGIEHQFRRSDRIRLRVPAHADART